MLTNGSYTDVEDNDSATLPETLWLSCNYPNPFNPQTTIEFELPDDQIVSLSVYDLSGRSVKTLARNASYSAGSHSVTWRGRDENGSDVPSGSYIIRLETDSGVEARKVALVR